MEERIINKELEKDPDLQFDDPYICTYDKKLDLLYEFEDALLKPDSKGKQTWPSNDPQNVR